MKFPALFLFCSLCLGLAAQDLPWISLFDGKSLSGWQANENASTWRVENGALVSRGERSHLFYVGHVEKANFKNFEFSVEVMTEPGSNSGIYIHTKLAPDPWPVAGYECQVINSPAEVAGKYQERKLTGSIYGVRNTWRPTAQDGLWFEYRIIVTGRTIRTFINGEKVCQYTEAANHWRAPDQQGRRLSRGTFALQGHDPKSVVRYRNIRVRVLPENEPTIGTVLKDSDLDELIARCSAQNFALIDLGITPGTVSLNQAQATNARLYGYSLGYRWPQGGLTAAHLPAGVTLINDRDQPPTVKQLKEAKAKGSPIAFTSGGDTWVSPVRIKARLQAILDAKLEWNDLWFPTPAR